MMDTNLTAGSGAEERRAALIAVIGPILDAPAPGGFMEYVGAVADAVLALPSSTPPAGSGEREGLAVLIDEVISWRGKEWPAERAALLDALAGYRATPKVEGSWGGWSGERGMWDRLRDPDRWAKAYDATPRLPAQEGELREADAAQLLGRLHRWFCQAAPKHYKGCGLWLEVEAALATPSPTAGESGQ